MPRSPESTAREAIRNRSSRNHFGRRANEDEGCVTGHPAFLSMAPAYELGRMAEGGGYPVGLVELAAQLMGITDLAAAVHVCSGSVRAPLTFDCRAESEASCLGDARRLPVRDASVRWVLIDPPYDPDYAEALWGTGKLYPTPTVLLREAARILVPGGMVGLLHHLVPVIPPDVGLERVGTHGVTTGPGYRIRCFTVARRVAPPLSLFSPEPAPMLGA